jgi:hypothetical protein
MSIGKWTLPLALVLPTIVSGCGLFVPEKDIFATSKLDQAEFENIIVNNIKCELHKGVQDVFAYYQTTPDQLARILWLKDWGATVQLKITADEQSGLGPGLTTTTPLENSITTFPVGGSVLSSQSTSVGLGASLTAHATRIETISFTVSFKELLSERPITTCDQENGVMIQSDLKIGQFIFDKSFLSTVPGSVEPFITRGPPYEVLSDEITFVASFGGNVTPTWKFARVAVDPSGMLLTATRTNTDDVIITLGQVSKQATPTSPPVLSAAAQNVHQANIIGSATGSSGNAQATMR